MPQIQTDTQCYTNVADLSEPADDNQGMFVIVMTHEDEVAERAKRVIRLRDGLIESDARQEPVVRTVSRNDIYQHIHGMRFDGLDRSIDLRISRLRMKVGDDPAKPKRIKSVRGVGYILAVDP